jgi:hypothetical protein
MYEGGRPFTTRPGTLIADTNDPDVVRHLVGATLRDPKSNPNTHSQLQQLLEEPELGIDYKLFDESGMSSAARTLGYDAVRIAEHGDVPGETSSLFFMNTNAVTTATDRELIPMVRRAAEEGDVESFFQQVGMSPARAQRLRNVVKNESLELRPIFHDDGNLSHFEASTPRAERALEMAEGMPPSQMREKLLGIPAPKTDMSAEVFEKNRQLLELPTKLVEATERDGIALAENSTSNLLTKSEDEVARAVESTAPAKLQSFYMLNPRLTYDAMQIENYAKQVGLDSKKVMERLNEVWARDATPAARSNSIRRILQQMCLEVG